MVTRGGVEPAVLAVKGRCLNRLTNEPDIGEDRGLHPIEMFIYRCTTILNQ